MRSPDPWNQQASRSPPGSSTTIDAWLCQCSRGKINSEVRKARSPPWARASVAESADIRRATVRTISVRMLFQASQSNLVDARWPLRCTRRPMSLSHPPVAGLFAAVVTPTHEDGQVDLQTLDRIVAFLLEAGVSGICIGGATGEYPHFESADRTIVIQRAARRAAGSALLVGIGGPSINHVIELGCASVDAGARALLLPMPMFFRYDQQDLEAFAADVAGALRTPCLLYNLPAFTNGLAPETMLNLLRTVDFITGVKDSSGEIANLGAIAEAARADSPGRCSSATIACFTPAFRRDGTGASPASRVLPRARRRALPELRRRRLRRNRAAPGIARRTHRAPRTVSHALGHSYRPRGARH